MIYKNKTYIAGFLNKMIFLYTYIYYIICKSAMRHKNINLIIDLQYSVFHWNIPTFIKILNNSQQQRKLRQLQLHAVDFITIRLFHTHHFVLLFLLLKKMFTYELQKIQHTLRAFDRRRILTRPFIKDL